MTGKQKKVPQEKIAGGETISIELMVKIRNVNSEIIRPSYQSDTTLVFMKLTYQQGKLIRTITMKIFIENAQGSYVTVVGKQLKLRCQIRTNTTADFSLYFISKYIVETPDHMWQQYSRHGRMVDLDSFKTNSVEKDCLA